MAGKKVEARRVSGRRDERQRNTRLRFEQWAKNPRCEANAISAVHNVKMVEVAKKAKVQPSFGASPFALLRGEQFERSLLDNDATRLLPELISASVLPKESSGLKDLRILMNRGTDRSLQDLDQATDATMKLLRTLGRLRGKSEVLSIPSVIAGATIKLPRGVMLPEALLILDVLAVRFDAATNRVELVVGEIKTYPDRGGFTDRAELAGARAQMGLYLHALRTVCEVFAEEERPRFSDTGFVVLTRPGSNFARVRANEDLRFQADRARRGFKLLEEAASRLPTVDELDAADTASRLDMVLHAQKDYGESCLGFCDLEPFCHERARASDDPIILGDDVRRFVSGLSLDRVVALLDGGAPLDDTETELMVRIRAAEDPGWA